MKFRPQVHRILTLGLAAACVTACATPYTGPVEVTRFVSDNPSQLGSGTIFAVIDGSPNDELRDLTYRNAVASELRDLGYLLDPAGPAEQVATIRVQRIAINDSEGDRSPVSVGVGGRTGSYGSGVGLGIGINLGGGGSKLRVVTTLSMQIRDEKTEETLWEGRAELVTSEDADLTDVEASAPILAAALFREFPGGNGETITIDTNDLQETQ
ncbi:MAG: DUF4136 domain-containing protein [Pseudomonadota bacterium]